jgi:glyoxylase-like metal-dependent hydrolase (beta-lactamase superfamily II)
MPLQHIVPGLYQIGLGAVNVFLLDDADGLTLIDAGSVGNDTQILEAVQKLGRKPTDITNILVTHCHPDHAGSLAALKRATGARAWMHPLDAALVRAGQAIRPMRAAPGLLNALLFRLFIQPASPTFPPAEVECEANDGDVIPVAGGIHAIHTPGHCAGQLVFLWPQHGGVLFAADAAANVTGLGLSIGYEDLAEGRRSLVKIAALDFAIACFGHGRPIRARAAERFRARFG